MINITVFIVEDDPMVLDVNKSFLTKITGFELIGEAQNGEDAIKQIIKRTKFSSTRYVFARYFWYGIIPKASK